jgi:hypothetical protein
MPDFPAYVPMCGWFPTVRQLVLLLTEVKKRKRKVDEVAHELGCGGVE